jgi:hypothetical protein
MDARVKPGHDECFCVAWFKAQFRDLAAGFARGLPRTSRSLISEGAGNAGRTMRPQPRAQQKKRTSVVTTVTPERPGIPRAMVYGLLRALPGDHACLTPSPARLLADLTPTIGASEPHDLAVRTSAIRQRRRRVHRIPPRVDDVAQRPSVGRDRIAIVLICPRRQAKFLKIGNCA